MALHRPCPDDRADPLAGAARKHAVSVPVSKIPDPGSAAACVPPAAAWLGATGALPFVTLAALIAGIVECEPADAGAWVEEAVGRELAYSLDGFQF